MIETVTKPVYPIPGRKPKEPKRSLRDTVFQNWAPPLLAGLLAFGSATYLAYRNDEVGRDKTYLDFRVRHADATAAAFSDYVSVWRRMIIRCDSHLSDKANANLRMVPKMKRLHDELLKDQIAGIRELLKARSERRDALFGKLEVLQLYVADPTVDAVEAFKIWDQKQQATECGKFPRIEEFQQYQRNIVRRLRLEVGNVKANAIPRSSDVGNL